MSGLKLSKEEEAIILERRRVRKFAEETKHPIKTAVAAHDIYYCDRESDILQYFDQLMVAEPKTFTKEDIDNFIIRVKNKFYVLIKKNSKFKCYCYDGVNEIWKTEDSNFETMTFNSAWATEHLTKFKDIKKKEK